MNWDLYKIEEKIIKDNMTQQKSEIEKAKKYITSDNWKEMLPLFAETIGMDLTDSDNYLRYGSELTKKMIPIFGHVLSSRLSHIKERISKMGKNNLPSPRSFGDGDIVDVSAGYNQALSDVLKLLEENNG